MPDLALTSVRAHVGLTCGVRPLSEVGELLGGVTLDQEVPVVQGLEVNFDDICTGVVDPHVLDSNHHH